MLQIKGNYFVRRGFIQLLKKVQSNLESADELLQSILPIQNLASKIGLDDIHLLNDSDLVIVLSITTIRRELEETLCHLHKILDSLKKENGRTFSKYMQQIETWASEYDQDPPPLSEQEFRAILDKVFLDPKSGGN